ncbi:AraC family transcriptional regulator [Nonomuraea lactucae]|uniref:AraC family transcriptional regulator n=1 Tax=Nonomuraea lactucae TaxID=2249762 RepID=UPI000DE22605|nr:AraC family transcriptional regulator [Nonomuraea lactucae]
MDVFSDVIATVRAGRAKFSRSLRTGPWGNRFGPYPGAGFHVLLHGGCWLIPPSGAPVQLSAGDVVFLPYGAMHGMSDSPHRTIMELPPEPDNGPAIRALHDEPDVLSANQAHLLCGAYRLERGQAHPFLRTLPEVVHIAARPGRHSTLRAAVDLLGADLSEPRPGAGAALPALMDLLLVYLLRAWLDDEVERRPHAGWPAALTDPVIATALHHIHHEPSRRWTVQDLGDTIGMSRTAFTRRFTSLVGQPPLAYLTWWRLNTGARLLQDTDAPLASIARQVGYTSEYAFANAFRREFGTAPGRFRRQHRSCAAGFQEGAHPYPVESVG